MKRFTLLLSFVLMLSVACERRPTPTATPPDNAGLTLRNGYSASVAVTELTGPTQMIWGPDDTLWVAQLGGGENEGQGEVVSVSLETGERRVLLAGLEKPTGLAVLNQEVWIAAGDTLLRSSLSIDQPYALGTPEVILDGLPTNGRSNGTLTVTPDGELLYETSGRRQGNRPAPDSATLWVLNPDTLESRPLATGLKNAYAHTYDAEGRLWTTDIADDPVNGQAAPDELNVVVEGADFGWPPCYDRQIPALNFEGTEAICAQTRLPAALFPPNSTPVSVVASPWEDNMMLVTLWRGPHPSVLAVPYTIDGDNATETGIGVFIDGLERPQHLLVLEDNSLLVSDHQRGTIYRIVRTAIDN